MVYSIVANNLLGIDFNSRVLWFESASVQKVDPRAKQRVAHALLRVSASKVNIYVKGTRTV